MTGRPLGLQQIGARPALTPAVQRGGARRAQPKNHGLKVGADPIACLLDAASLHAHATSARAVERNVWQQSPPLEPPHAFMGLTDRVSC